MKSQFGYRPHPQPRETCLGADAARQTPTVLQIFRPVLLPPLLPQEIRRYDPPDAKFQPLVRAKMVELTSFRVLATPLFRPRSTRCLALCHRRRCAPSHEKPVLQLTTAQRGDASTVQSNPSLSGPL